MMLIPWTRDLLGVGVWPSHNDASANDSVVVEIEMGKSDVVTNFKQDLLMESNVMVVLTHLEALGSVEWELAREDYETTEHWLAAQCLALQRRLKS